MADAAKSAGLAAAAGEVTSIASQAGCFFIARTQLAILRKATTDAAPVVAALVAVIEQREMQLYGIIRDDDLAQIKDAGDDYQATGSAADLADVAALTASLDRAQRAPAYAAVAQLTDLHGALQAGLAAPTVDLAGVVKAARALIDKARDAEGAASALGDSAVRSHDASAKRETASPPAPRRKGNGGKAAVHEAHSA
jgi:hypothetical protein